MLLRTITVVFFILNILISFKVFILFKFDEEYTLKGVPTYSYFVFYFIFVVKHLIVFICTLFRFYSLSLPLSYLTMNIHLRGEYSFLHKTSVIFFISSILLALFKFWEHTLKGNPFLFYSLIL
jgi:hypothetical protein